MDRLSPGHPLLPLKHAAPRQRAPASTEEGVRKLLVPWQAKIPAPAPSGIQQLCRACGSPVLPWELAPSTASQSPMCTLVLA